VSSREIEACIDEGATTVEEISLQCGAGTDCGGCLCEIQSMLDQAAADRSGARRLPVLQPAQRVA
jgi:bacterioferritin-associated ferredoxin